MMSTIQKDIIIKLNDITVCYSDDGNDAAPAIIFIHGFPFNKSMWHYQVAAFKDNYRLISYDVRGHGKTDTGTEDFTIDLFTKDLIALMDELELEQVTLCGLSMGGYIALDAMEKHPERISALILCDTQCTAETPEAYEKKMQAIENIKVNRKGQFADESIKNLFAPESYNTKQTEIAHVFEMIMDTNTEALCKTLEALATRNSTCEKLSEIEVPVLILVGKEDRVTPPAASRLMNGKISGSEMLTIVHAGHVANMENPEAFNEALIKFMQQFDEEPLNVSFTNNK
jgi:3-oxoadipate enol-lactonase